MEDLFNIQDILRTFHALEEEQLVKLLENKMLITGDKNIYVMLKRKYPKLRLYYSRSLCTEVEKVFLLDFINPQKIGIDGDIEVFDCCVPSVIQYTSPQISYNPESMESNVYCKVGIVRKDGIPI